MESNKNIKSSHRDAGRGDRAVVKGTGAVDFRQGQEVPWKATSQLGWRQSVSRTLKGRREEQD